MHRIRSFRVRRFSRFMAATGLLVLLTGCAGNTGDLEGWVAEVKSRRGAPLDPLPVLRTFEPFEYNAFHLREPFAFWDDEEARTSTAAGPRPDPGRRKEALELFPLDALAMVGTIGLGSDMFGVIKAPDGVIYRVRANNYVGQSDGRITGIHEDRIEVMELIPNGVGGWIEQSARIPLESSE